MTAAVYRVSLVVMKMFLELDNGDGHTTLKSTKTLNWVPYKNELYGMQIKSQ